MIDVHFSAAYAAAVLALAALFCEEAADPLVAARGTPVAAPRAAGNEHPGLPGPIRRPPDRTTREQAEHPTAQAAGFEQVAQRAVDVGR